MEIDPLFTGNPDGLALIDRARVKAARREIDKEFLDIFTQLRSLWYTPVLCDGAGNKVLPGGPIPSEFTVRVGTLTCIKA